MTTLIDIYNDYRNDSDFDHLRKIGIKFVGGDGNAKNPVAMLVGEAPGKMETALGLPFVGSSGLMLNDLMYTAGLSLDNCYLTNVVKYRPVDVFFQTRAPSKGEVQYSKPYLSREYLTIGEPKLIIPIGTIASRLYCKPFVRITDIAYKRQTHSGYTIWPVVHPAYLVRNMGEKNYHMKRWETFGQWLIDNEYL